MPDSERTAHGLSEPEQLAIKALKEAAEWHLDVITKYCQPGHDADLARDRVIEAEAWSLHSITGRRRG